MFFWGVWSVCVLASVLLGAAGVVLGTMAK